MRENIENIASVGQGFSSNNLNSIEALQRITSLLCDLASDERYAYDSLFGEQENVHEAAKAVLRIRERTDRITAYSDDIMPGGTDARQAALKSMGRELRAIAVAVADTVEEAVTNRIKAEYGL